MDIFREDYWVYQPEWLGKCEWSPALESDEARYGEDTSSLAALQLFFQWELYKTIITYCQRVVD